MTSEELKNFVLFPDTSKKWSYTDVVNWGEDVHVEILNGELFLSPTPTFYHQTVSLNLVILMSNFIKKFKLGKIVTAPQDTRLGNFNLVQPDILFISNQNTKVRIDKTVIGPPDLVVEIISPSSVSRDYHKKKDIYEKFKVQEYWIVDPGNQSVEVLYLVDDKYEILSLGDSLDKKVFSKVLAGFEVTLAEIFEE
ncbi:MAG: Uma2 family endonuclease [Bacteroidota bacterium]|nr:Uma2 family endonuclease [Bacteroidota bacterium]